MARTSAEGLRLKGDRVGAAKWPDRARDTSLLLSGRSRTATTTCGASAAGSASAGSRAKTPKTSQSQSEDFRLKECPATTRTRGRSRAGPGLLIPFESRHSLLVLSKVGCSSGSRYPCLTAICHHDLLCCRRQALPKHPCSATNRHRGCHAISWPS